MWGRASHHKILAPTFPRIDNCLIMIEQDFLEMEASLWLNEKSWVSLKVDCLPLCCWEAAVHTLDWSWKKMDVKLMMMLVMRMKIIIIINLTFQHAPWCYQHRKSACSAFFPTASWNSTVFSCSLKVLNVRSLSRNCPGRKFQKKGPEMTMDDNDIWLHDML